MVLLNTADNLLLGASPVNRVYVGTTKVWGRLGTLTAITGNGSTTDSTTYTTASITPTTGDLVIAVCSAATASGGADLATSMSGLGLTWTSRVSQLSATPTIAMNVWTAVATGSSGALTFTYPDVQGAAVWSVFTLANGAFKQAATNTDTTTPVIATLSTTAVSGNTCLALMALNANAPTVDPSGGTWTEFTEQNQTVPSLKMQSMHGPAQTTATWAVGSGNTAQRVKAIIEFQKG